MMVHFLNDKLIIEIKTTTAVEDWMIFHESLADLIERVTSETISDQTFYGAASLLRELLPDFNVAKRMAD